MVSTMTPELNKQLANELNEEMRSTVMPVTVFVGLEAVFGLCGNILILYVFIFHYHKCNFKYFVLCLSFVDTTSTLTTLPGEIVTQTFWYVYPVPMVCKIKSFFNMFTVCGSAFALLIISFDRFRKVCRPLEWQLKPRVALILIFMQLTIACIIAMPVPFFWGTHSYTKLYKGHNITVTICEIDAKFMNTDHPLQYTIVTETMFALVMTVMFILYVFVCRKLLSIRSIERKNSNPAEVSNIPQSGGQNISDGACSDDANSVQYEFGGLQDTADSTECSGSADSTACKNAIAASDNKFTEKKPSAMFAKRKISTRNSRKKKIRRKTLIMFILTAVFIFTTILYLTLLNLIAKGVLESLSKRQKSVYFFFFRLYFINHVINPILYGILDPKFRQILTQTYRSARNRCLRRQPFNINT